MKMNHEIKNYKNQNKLDLEKIIDEYSGYVYKIIENANVACLLKEDREEILADTFFILWKNTEKLDDEKALKPYIAGIVKNLIREKRRKSSYHKEFSELDNDFPDATEMNMVCEERETIYLIEKSLNKMKSEDVEIFKLYYYSARKIREISNILGISEFSVKSKLHRMRSKIKKDLEKGGYR